MRRDYGAAPVAAALSSTTVDVMTVAESIAGAGDALLPLIGAVDLAVMGRMAIAAPAPLSGLVRGLKLD